jgi:hypothetical protein
MPDYTVISSAPPSTGSAGSVNPTNPVAPSEELPPDVRLFMIDLKPEQRRFCEVLLADPAFDVKAAARKVDHTLAWGKKVIAKPEIAKLLKTMVDYRARKANINAARVLDELARIAFFNPKQLMDANGVVLPLKDIPEAVLSAVQSMRVSFGESPEEDGTFTRVKHVDMRFWNKMDAISMLAKHLGLLRELVTNQVNIVNLDWSRLFQEQASQRIDPIEERLRQEEALLAAQGIPVAVEHPPVAGTIVVQQQQPPGPQQTNGHNGIQP